MTSNNVQMDMPVGVQVHRKSDKFRISKLNPALNIGVQYGLSGPSRLLLSFQPRAVCTSDIYL